MHLMSSLTLFNSVCLVYLYYLLSAKSHYVNDLSCSVLTICGLFLYFVTETNKFCHILKMY